MSKCKVCGGTSVDFDASTGSTICMTCGEVLEEGRVVNELSFSQSASGRVGLVGQRVNLTNDSSRLIWGGQSGDSSLALATTIQRGGVRTEWIGQRLGLRNHTIEEAKRMFQLAAQRNFTAGRRTSHVSAACLYIVCRRDKAPVMLLDFADALHVSVRELGQIYMKLVRLLNLDKVLDIPIIDPSLFMERFSAKLSLGSDEQAVCHTAVRLIQAMSRDWICTGRRPTGLCGAALLIACRAHGVTREASEIAEIVRIGEVTIKRRLYELQNTSTAALTFDEFEALALDAPQETSLALNDMNYVESLPPSLIKNRAKEAKERARLALEDVCSTTPDATQISTLADSLLSAIENGNIELPTTESTGVKASQEPTVSTPKSSTNILQPIFEDDEEFLLSDDEVGCDSDLDLLDDTEMEAKSHLWHQWSKPWLLDWESRQETKKRKPNETSSRPRMQPQSSASESTRLALNKKAKLLNSRVTDDMLDQLFKQPA